MVVPGVSIRSTVSEEGYGYYSETSVSAAVTSELVWHCSRVICPNWRLDTIKERILCTVAPCTNLAGKVDASEYVHALGALTETLPVPDDGEEDFWYLMDELVSNVERFYYGEGGENSASGNYLVTCTNMSIPALGFAIEISRSYNSRDGRKIHPKEAGPLALKEK